MEVEEQEDAFGQWVDGRDLVALCSSYAEDHVPEQDSS